MNHPGVVFGLTTLAYVVVAQLLIKKARSYPVDANHVFWPLDLFRPEHYTPDGNRWRLIALGFLLSGAITLTWSYQRVS